MRLTWTTKTQHMRVFDSEAEAQAWAKEHIKRKVDVLEVRQGWIIYTWDGRKAVKDR